MLVAHERQMQTVVQCCERADEQGVRPGMPAAQARAIFRPGGVRIETHQAQEDARALHTLAKWAMRLSPLVEVDPPDGLMLDVTGCERVFKGEASLASKAVDAMQGLDIRCRLAITPTMASAWAFARYSDTTPQVVSPASLRSSLTPLPIAALRISEDTARTLAELGIERIEHLLDLPRSTLPARFGAALLLRLDQALGHAIETLEPIRPASPIRADREFEGPTDRVEALEITVRHLLIDIADQLQAREQGAMSAEITLIRSDLPPETITISMGRPSRDASHLWKLVAPRLERANLGFGVEAIRVEAVSVASVRHEQSLHAGINHRARHADAERAASELVDTLTNRLGSDRVCRPVLVPSHRPERAGALSPSSSIVSRETFRPVSSDRPTLLLSRPEAASVMALTPDGPVHSVRWRSEDHVVVACIGPERIGSEWWRSKGSTRDYFRIQTRNGWWLWLARSLETNRWFVHGIWA